MHVALPLHALSISFCGNHGTRFSEIFVTGLLLDLYSNSCLSFVSEYLYQLLVFFWVVFNWDTLFNDTQLNCLIIFVLCIYFWYRRNDKVIVNHLHKVEVSMSEAQS